jgi:hypothetical protein
MKAAFNDLQDYSSHLDGTVVHNDSEVLSILASVRDRESFACELEGDNGYKLTIGIGNDVGFVQHSSIDGDSPYLVALAPGFHIGELDEEQKYVEFLCGDTPSPIAKRYILPFDIVMQIAACFVETGERSPSVFWEEI